jgi:hypothetical protein
MTGARKARRLAKMPVLRPFPSQWLLIFLCSKRVPLPLRTYKRSFIKIKGSILNITTAPLKMGNYKTPRSSYHIIPLHCHDNVPI